MVLILLGLSGSGKGTQAERLVREFGFEYIVMGDLLRLEIKRQTVFGKKIHQLINVRGELVPDQITTEIFKKEFIKKAKSKRIILDGYPRTMPQVVSLNKMFDELKIKDYLALNIKISEEEAIKRLSGRLVCSRCGTIHFPGDLKCKKCGGKLMRRPDDAPERVRARIAWGKKEVEEVIDYYKKIGKLIEIKGLGSVNEVYKTIIQKLKNYL